MFLFNCSGSSDSSNWDVDVSEMNPGDNKGDWLIVHELSDTDGLNPYTSTGAGGTYIYHLNIFESMLVQDNNTLEYKPLIAKKMPEISVDNLTYTFELREDVYFSDGRQVTAEEFIFSLKALKNPFTDAAPLRKYFKDGINELSNISGRDYSRWIK